MDGVATPAVAVKDVDVTAGVALVETGGVKDICCVFICRGVVSGFDAEADDIDVDELVNSGIVGDGLVNSGIVVDIAI